MAYENEKVFICHYLCDDGSVHDDEHLMPEYVDEAVENGGTRQVAEKATVKLRFTSPEGADVSVSQSACLATRLPYHACLTGCQRQGDDRPLHL